MKFKATYIPDKGIYEMVRLSDDDETEEPGLKNPIHEAMAQLLLHAFNSQYNIIMSIPTDYGRSVGMLVTDKKGRAIVKLELEYMREEFYV